MTKPTIPNEFQTLLAKLGLSQRSIHRIRFGGVVGKQALVAVSALLGLAAIAFKTNDALVQWVCLILIGLVALYGITAIGFHGHKHPVEATLEGGEIVVWKHMEQQYAAAKGMDNPPSQPMVAEGLGAKPLDEYREGERH